MVTFVMSVYKNDDVVFLRQSIDSMLNQTYKEIIVLIVVDGLVGSDLDSVLSDYEEKFDNVNLVRLTSNLGRGLARNVGIESVSTEYMAIMDSDDICSPDRIKEQLDYLVNTGSDVVFSSQSGFCNDIGNPTGIKRPPVDHDDIVRVLKTRCILPNPSLFGKTKVIKRVGGYGKSRNVGEDWVLFARLVAGGAKLSSIDMPLIYVREAEERLKRRGGLKLLKEDVSNFKEMYRIGFFSKLDVCKNLIVYSFFRVSPAWLRRFMYKNLLRA